MNNKSESNTNNNFNENDQITSGVYSNDSGVVKSYFKFYSKISNQQNMLQDYIRTSTYFNAINLNKYVIFIK